MVVDLNDCPTVVYWGAALGDAPPAELLDHPLPVGDLDDLAPVAILPEASLGFPGAPGCSGGRADGRDWAPRFAVESHHVEGPKLSITMVDEIALLGATISLEVESASGVLCLWTEVVNLGRDDYRLAAVTMTLPVGQRATEAMLYRGRWGNEFQLDRLPWPGGTVTVENRRGRTSHDRFPFVAAGTAAFDEESGELWAGHLGWSGNAVVRLDTLSDGRRFLQAGEMLLPGEVDLAPGDSYRSPTFYAARSNEGMNGLRRGFHGFLRQRPCHPSSPRPVLLNTWEAVYFDHDLATLEALADRAADVGIERFVLDDGWFHGRRDDSAGLGDWWVDADVWPDGLAPLTSHVADRGMEFGIWVEPEMVNPDSDLFRSHPEWVLNDDRYEPVLGRHQLVLDLARDEVSEYLFEHLDRLLTDHDIAYVKWDMNRDLVHASHDRRAAVRVQTLAAYDLIDRLRAAHPGVEIESCASGGGRADYGILERTDRVWVSDCNDALDRVSIQHGAGLLLPPELMGAHIGGPRAHTTGRRHGLGLRASVAFFGHLGVEWNLLEAGAGDLAELGRIIALHKEHRALLHGGMSVGIEHPDPAVTVNGVIAQDRSEALVAVVQTATSATLAVAPLRVAGLLPDARYRAEMISLGSSPLGMAYEHPRWVVEGVEVSGRALANAGLPLPVLLPETARLVHMTRVV